MLVESFVFASSLRATPRGFRPHLAEAVGLWARGERQRAAWAPHIAHTRDLIDTQIDQLPQRRTVAVLGSGPLFDVPVESLARTFETVLLIDRAHLSTTRRRVARYPNVRQIWHDLSAATNPLHLELLAATPDLDWVVSLNLLSQLARGAPEGEERAVINAHLDGLRALPCPALLVTDFCYRLYDRQDVEKEYFDLLHGQSMPRFDRRWVWDVAPFGEEARDTRRVHSVAAWLDWRKATTA
jgi:hypothetical protein